MKQRGLNKIFALPLIFKNDMECQFQDHLIFKTTASEHCHYKHAVSSLW